MEHQKALNLLNESSDSKFVARKRNIGNYQSNRNDHAEIEIICNTEVLKSNLCDYSGAYILVRGKIIIVGNNATQAAFKNYAPFIK